MSFLSRNRQYCSWQDVSRYIAGCVCCQFCLTEACPNESDESYREELAANPG